MTRTWRHGVTALVSAGLAAGAVGGLAAAGVISGPDTFGGAATPQQLDATHVAALDTAAPADAVPSDLARDISVWKELPRSDIDPETVHRSQYTGTASAVWLAKTRQGEICLMTTGPTGPSETCNDRSMLATWGAIPLAQGDDSGSTVSLVGVVPDGFASASVGTQRATITDNTFVLHVARGTPSAIVTISGPAGAKRLNYTAFLPAG